MENNRISQDRQEFLMMDLHSKTEVGDRFLNRTFTENEKMTLQKGGTLHWKNMDIGGKEKRDINVKLQAYVNEKGEVEKGMTVEIKKDKLEIPDKILDKKLNNEEVESLKNGNFFCLEKENKNFLIKIDQKVNNVVIRTPAELGIKEELGGYKFDKNELARLSNGQQVGPKVYESEKHGFFISNLKIENQGASFEYTYSDIVNISKKEAELLKPLLNNQKGPMQDHEVNKILDIMGAGKNEEISKQLKKAVDNGKSVPDKQKNVNTKNKVAGPVKNESNKLKVAPSPGKRR